MVFLTGRNRFFRWHDAGDIQSVAHLHMIAEVASRTPNTKHWLPTREYKMVQDFCATSEVPANLIIRLSAHMIDGPTPDKLAKKLGVCVSGVGTKSCTCPAPAQKGACKNCRKCWTRNVFSVIYHKH